MSAQDLSNQGEPHLSLRWDLLSFRLCGSRADFGRVASAPSTPVDPSSRCASHSDASWWDLDRCPGLVSPASTLIESRRLLEPLPSRSAAVAQSSSCAGFSVRGCGAPTSPWHYRCLHALLLTSHMFTMLVNLRLPVE